MLRQFPMILCFAALTLASPHDARAAACCGSGHGLGQRLSRGERAALTLAVRGADRFGSNDPQGQFFPTPAGTLDGEGRAELSGLFAPVPRLQLGVAIPFVLNVRQFGSDSAHGGGLGDVAASARFDIVPLATSKAWPAIALTAGLTVPTGRSTSDARNVLAADATGLGVFEFRPGVFLEKSFSGEATAIFAGSLGLRSPSTDARGEPVQLAPRLRLLAAAGPIFDNGLSLSMGLIHEREQAPSIGGVTSPNADRYRTALLAFVGYDLSPRFTLLGSCELDLPWNGASKNEPTSAAFSIGLRRSFSTEK